MTATIPRVYCLKWETDDRTAGERHGRRNLPTHDGDTGRREADDERTNVPREGAEVSKVMAPASRFGAKAAERDDKRHRVADRLSDYYRKFRSLTAHYPNLEDDL